MAKVSAEKRYNRIPVFMGLILHIVNYFQKIRRQVFIQTRYLLKRLSCNLGHKNGHGHGGEQIHIIIFNRVASLSYQLPYWHEL